MDFSDWVADLATGTATHASGFTLRVEGNPRDPSSVDPGKFPADLSFVDQARLLRSGLEFLAKTASGSRESWSTSSRSDDMKTAAIREREAQAKRFADNPDKPKRSVLSLKKS
jgi:hypothetical protein